MSHAHPHHHPHASRPPAAPPAPKKLLDLKIEGTTYAGGGSLIKIQASGHTKRRRGAVLLTPSFKGGNTINVVIYYHGHWVGVDSFEGLLGHRTTARLIENAMAAGKPLAIGIPDMGANANDPKVDWASDQVSFDSFVGDVLMVAAQRANEIRSGLCLVDPSIDHRTGKPVTPLALGNLILAAHSGGGYPLWRTVQNRSTLLAQLKELWMFDSFYGGFGVSVKNWGDWIVKSGVDVDIFFTPGEKGTHATKVNTEALEQMKPRVPRTTVWRPPDSDHHAVPGNHVAKLISDSGYL